MSQAQIYVMVQTSKAAPLQNNIDNKVHARTLIKSICCELKCFRKLNISHTMPKSKKLKIMVLLISKPSCKYFLLLIIVELLLSG